MTSATVCLYKLKSHPHSFVAIWDGDKTYDVRADDRAFAVGDQLDLREWQPPSPLQLKAEGYSGRQIRAVVTYKTPGGNYGLPIGLCVLGLKVDDRRAGVYDDRPAQESLGDGDVVSDVEVFPCACGGKVRVSAKGEPVADSLRYAMHTRPVCAPFEAKVRELFDFVTGES